MYYFLSFVYARVCACGPCRGRCPYPGWLGLTGKVSPVLVFETSAVDGCWFTPAWVSIARAWVLVTQLELIVGQDGADFC